MQQIIANLLKFHLVENYNNFLPLKVERVYVIFMISQKCLEERVMSKERNVDDSIIHS